MRNRVLIIIENSNIDVDLRVLGEATALRANGYEVTVVCPKGAGNNRRYEVIDGIHIYRHPIPQEGAGLVTRVFEYGSAFFWEFILAWWIYFRRGFDIIQGCNPPDTIFLVALPFKLFGVKYIFDHHDVCPELYHSIYGKTGIVYKIQSWLEKLTFRTADVVISTNDSYKEIAIKRGGMNPADVFVVRNGPDLDRVKLVPANPALKHGKRYLVGYVGAIGIQEGLDILLEVAGYIKNQGRSDVHFTCVGDGPYVPTLRKILKEKGLDDLVNFTGSVSDEELMEILSTSDICVNPDKPCVMNDISTMIKIMEYMALGKPIVQFDVKEGRVSAGDSSLYASEANAVPDFAAKVLWLLDHPAQRAAMGEIGRQRIERELAWDYSIPNLLSAYESASGGGGGTVQVSRLESGNSNSQ